MAEPPNPDAPARARRAVRGRPSGEPGEAAGRDLLLRAARDVLRRTPPAQVTRLLIADEAKVDPNLIRYYFGTVSRLISEVVLESHASIQEELDRRIPVERPTDWLQERIGALLSMFLANPYHHQLLIQVMYEDGASEAHAAWTRSLQRSVDVIRTRLDAGVEQGELRAVDPRFLNLAMLGMTEFFANNDQIIRDMFGDGGTPSGLSDAYAAFLYDLLLHGLKPRD